MIVEELGIGEGVKRHLNKNARDEAGATTSEYVILASLIAVAVIITVQLVGERLDKMLDEAVTLLIQKR